jgi:hypothetical protein
MDKKEAESDLHVDFAQPNDLGDFSAERFAHVLVESVFDPPSQGIVNYYRHEIEELLNKGQLVVGKLDEQVVGMIAYNLWGEFDGREVYELSKGSVLDECQGRGYYDQLKRFIIDYLKKEHPDCLTVAFSRNPKVIEHGKKHFPGMQVISLLSDHPIAVKFCSSCDQDSLDDMIKRGIQILLYDLRELGD